MAQNISTFDDWTDYFNKGQKDIGFDAHKLKTTSSTLSTRIRLMRKSSSGNSRQKEMGKAA
jgi:hypothetical protein